MNTARAARLALCLGLCAQAFTLGGAARAAGSDPADPGRISVLEENDGIISHKDRYYTQGLQVSYLSPDLSGHDHWNDVFDAVGVALPMFRDEAEMERRFEFVPLAQAEFTPANTKVADPPPGDRPYDAWLFTGVHLLQENDRHSLNNLDLLAGVVGSDAGGYIVQGAYHTLVGFNRAQGWSHALPNHAAGQLSYDYRRRFSLDLGSGYGVDAIPEAGLSLGNVYRYVDVGALFRVGNALALDYGPEHMRPSLSGTAYSDYRRLSGSWFHWYAYAGMQEREMFYNIFIDEADKVAPAGLDRIALVPDYVGGATLLFGHFLRADFVAIRRGKEFYGQNGPDVFGGVNLTFRL